MQLDHVSSWAAGRRRTARPCAQRRASSMHPLAVAAETRLASNLRAEAGVDPPRCQAALTAPRSARPQAISASVAKGEHLRIAVTIGGCRPRSSAQPAPGAAPSPRTRPRRSAASASRRGTGCARTHASSPATDGPRRNQQILDWQKAWPVRPRPFGAPVEPTRSAARPDHPTRCAGAFDQPERPDTTAGRGARTSRAANGLTAGPGAVPLPGPHRARRTGWRVGVIAFRLDLWCH